MKLNPRDAASFFAKPDLRGSGILIHGADAMRIALHRQDLVAAAIGPDGEAEMRFARLAATDLRKDPAALLDALKAQGFFPGQRVVLVEEATDTITKTVSAALEEWQPGDAFLVVTAGQLNARSSLRKLFEGGEQTLSAAIYSDPASREEIEAALARAGLTEIPSDVMQDITALGRALDPGDFRQTLEKIALYALDDPSALTPEAIALLAPGAAEPEIEDAVNLAAEGDVARLSAVLARFQTSANPTSFCIQAIRHFRTLHLAAIDPQGPEAGLSRARPPVFGPRRDRMARQARAWGPARLEAVLGMITETDLALRSPKPLPGLALVERLFIRIAMQNRR